jgi:hypothetical protein
MVDECRRVGTPLNAPCIRIRTEDVRDKEPFSP